MGHPGRKFLAVACVAFLGCSRDESDPNASGAGSSTASAPAKAAPVAARGRLLQRLPDETLAFVRVPRLSALKSLAEDPGLIGTVLRAAADQIGGGAGADGMLETMGMGDPRLRPVIDLLASLDGEAVVGVGLKRGKADAPPTPSYLAAFVELGQREADVKRLLPGIEGQVHGGRDVHIELAVQQGVLGICGSPSDGPTGTLAKLFSQRAEESVLATDLVRTMPKAPEGADEPTFELALSFVELGRAMPQAPREMTSFLDRSGLGRMRGMSLLMAVGKAGYTETITFHGGSEANLATRVLRGRGLEANWTKLMLPDAESVSLLSCDFGKAFAEIVDLMDDQMQHVVQTGLLSFQQKLGVDVRGDLVDNLGPHVLVSTRGGVPMMPSAAAALDLVVAIELRTPDRARAAIEKLVKTAGLGAYRTSERVAGIGEIHTIRPPL
ncbi:MAG TPA: hypothetical protein VKE69_05710, partial [Planctomycetota bacterium]|nr:hypothetical protein [Planctomycetota bacterium]